MEENFIIRNLDINDYGILEVLQELSVVDDMTEEEFYINYSKILINKRILVIEYILTRKIIGTGSIFFEYKFIHNIGCVGHIEDVVIKNDYRNKNLGKILIENLINIGREFGCYKIILDCNVNNVKFYEKCGFKQKEICMAKYF